MQSVALSVKEMYTYLVVQLVATLQNTRLNFSEVNVGPTVRWRNYITPWTNQRNLHTSGFR